MYCTDSATGETVFELVIPPRARQVFLECFNEREHFCVPMTRAAKNWITRLPLAAGWFFYRLKVDGQVRCARGVGRVRTPDGERYHLAVIAPTSAVAA